MNRRVEEVRITPVQSEHHENLVAFVLVDPHNRGVGTTVAEEDLVFIRDRIDDYIRGNFPGRNRYTEEEDG